jgi:histidyl-tRNA synthetase
MRDYLPELCEIWESVEQAIRDVVRLYGYRQIRTPIVEKTDLFSRSIGEVTDIVEKEMYTFQDRNGDSLTLRPEATASCVRAGIQHGLLHNQTHRLWYLGPMFRHERPQKGRYRQFHQFGIEALGWTGPDIDSEIIALGSRLWENLELKDIELEINTLGSETSRLRYLASLKMFLIERETELDETSQKRLEVNPLRILDSKNVATQKLLDHAPELINYLDDTDKRQFDALLKYLDRLGVKYQVNNRLVRGLDYYTGPVYEWKSSNLGSQNAFCGGGRYDGLVKQLGGPSFPAAGFACGMERLVELYMQSQTSVGSSAEVWMVMLGEVGEEVGYPLAEELRRSNIQVVSDCSGGDIKKQLRRANRANALIAIIIGDEELAGETFTVKPLQSGENQMSVTRDRLIDTVLIQLKRETMAL